MPGHRPESNLCSSSRDPFLRGEKRRHFSGSRVSHLFFAVHALVNRREAMQVRHALHY
jgi:hypothetical protein